MGLRPLAYCSNIDMKFTPFTPLVRGFILISHSEHVAHVLGHVVSISELTCESPGWEPTIPNRSTGTEPQAWKRVNV